MEENIASVHLKECVSGFCLQEKEGEFGFKRGRRGRERGFFGWVRLEYSENREELREFARKKERKTWVRGEVSF